MLAFNPFYHALSYLVPFYGGSQPVWQQAGIFVGLGMVGVASLVGAIPSRRLRWGVAVVILAAALGERALVLPVPVVLDKADTRVSTVYDQARGAGGLVDIPRFRPGIEAGHAVKTNKLSVGPMFTAQIRHGHPIPVGININRGFFDDYSPLVSLQARSWQEVAHCLRRRGYRWVVVHRDLFDDPGLMQACVQGFHQAVGTVTDDDFRTLFDLSRLKARDVEESERCPERRKTSRDSR